MPKRRKSDGKAKERRWKSVETEEKLGKPEGKGAA